MRLMREVPEVKTHLEKGALTLTSAALIQRHIRAEKAASARPKQDSKPQIKKSDLIAQCLGQSKRSVEKILIDEETRELFKQTLKTFIEQREKQMGKVASEPTRPDVQPAQSNDPYSRYIPMQMKRAVFERSSGQCEHIAPNTNARCPSKAHLHIYHVIPLAVGGKTELKNLRHLCPAHNRKAAQIAGIHIQEWFTKLG